MLQTAMRIDFYARINVKTTSKRDFLELNFSVRWACGRLGSSLSSVVIIMKLVHEISRFYIEKTSGLPVLILYRTKT